MKSLLSLLFISLFVISCESSYSKDSSAFYMKLDLISQEHSKDSNYQSYKIEIHNDHVQYQFQYSGRRPKKIMEPNEDFYLSKKEQSDLINRIKKYNLLQNIEESKELSGLGRSIQFHLIIKYAGKSYESNIKGMLYLLKLRKSNLDNSDFAKKVNSIARIIHNIAVNK